MSKIVAFSGKAYSGKSTAAKTFVEVLPNYRIVSFAAPIKKMVVEHFPDLVTMDDVLNHKDKVIDIDGKLMTVRDILIEFGRMYRGIDPGYWLKKAMRTAAPHLEAGGGIAIDDLRYPNEISTLEKMGARIIRVERPGLELIDDPSETLLDNYQFREYLDNDLDLANFVNRAARAAKAEASRP